MASITFNTLRYANRLKAAGVDPKQAEAEAEALSEVFETGLNDVVTKSDLQVAIRDLEQRMTIKLGSMMVVAIGVTAALVKLL